MNTSEQARRAARRVIDAAHPQLVALSHRIHGHPELGFEEERAAGWLADMLEAEGFTVRTGVADLPTALHATRGSGPLHVSVCAEYDALPGVGHACGHNMIAATGAGAAVGLAGLVDDLGITLHVHGTPAEEGGGGKVRMLEAGEFDGVHLSLMAHPSPLESVTFPCLAMSNLSVRYTGMPVHAAMRTAAIGRSAPDAMDVARVGLGLLHQHLRPYDRVNGVIADGGLVPNVAPAAVTAHYYVRAANRAQLADLEARVIDCFRAGAVAAGVPLEIEHAGPGYAEFRHDDLLQRLYRGQVERCRVDLAPDGAVARLAASTDMGNVSQVVPSIHPMIATGYPGVLNHTSDFADVVIRPSADAAVARAATLLAWTVVDAATEPEPRGRLLDGDRDGTDAA